MTKVYLNVYDLNPQLNKHTYSLGFGFFHSGVQITGTQYTFGGHDGNFTGVMQVEPKVNHPNFRQSIFLGESTLTSKQITKIIDTLRFKFIGNTYHIIKRNCNNFSQSLVKRLLGISIPGWVNRLAWTGSIFYSCMDFIRLQKAIQDDNKGFDLKQKNLLFKGKNVKIGDALIEQQ